MCNRVSTPDYQQMIDFVDRQPAFKAEDYLRAYHMLAFDRLPLPVITADDQDHLQLASWALIPDGTAPDADIKKATLFTVNAKHEKLYSAWPWSGPANRGQRCVIFIEGFFEFKHEDPSKKNSPKYPHYIYMPDRKPFALAGLYNDWRDKDGEIHRTATIVTAEAVGFMKEIHNSAQRMPMLMVEENWDIWLDPKADRASIESLMRPYPLDGFQYHEIDNRFFKKGGIPNVREVQEPK